MYNDTQIQQAIKLITSTIINCEKMHDKFPEGKSQHTLLKNRIKALNIALEILETRKTSYSKDELIWSITPISSIISKTTKAQSKYEIDSKQFLRFQPLVTSMSIAKYFIEHTASQL